MRYLIDTNIFVYINSDPSQLSREVRRILEDYESVLYLSSESVREILHLFQNGKIRSKKWKSAHDIFSCIEKEWNITISYVKKEHLLTLAHLDVVSNHNDPNDRLIIAQAITEKIPLISSDRKFEHYRKQKLNFIYNKR
jgi:PIN domain nuclease of toxin-antitoxin system